MGQLQALQEELRRLLFIGSELKSSPFWKEGLPPRLQVYRNTVHGNCYDTLDSDYPLTQKQFSADDWFDLSVAYFSKYPARYWELNNCIVAFPKFLKAHKSKSHIVDLAEYELADLLTFINTSVVQKKTGTTNPTLTTRVMQYQIFDWVTLKCPPEKIPAQKPEVLVFYRDSKNDCYIRKMDPLMLLMLDHFRNPDADTDELEPIRAKLLPQNKVPLAQVLDELVQAEMILL